MTAEGGVVLGPHTAGPVPAQNVELNGLTGNEAKVCLEQDGRNAMPETPSHPIRNALTKFWAPVPWLLEAAISARGGAA